MLLTQARESGKERRGKEEEGGRKRGKTMQGVERWENVVKEKERRRRGKGGHGRVSGDIAWKLLDKVGSFLFNDLPRSHPPCHSQRERERKEKRREGWRERKKKGGIQWSKEGGRKNGRRRAKKAQLDSKTAFSQALTDQLRRANLRSYWTWREAKRLAASEWQLIWSDRA